MTRGGLPRLSIRGVSKSFGSTQALESISLDLYPGEALALVGENGAGKSTLLKILSGAHTADQGELTIDGEPYLPSSPMRARELGVAMIYQELSLAPHLTVLENILLGRDSTLFGILKRSDEKKIAARALERIGQPHIDLNTQVRRLTPAERQLVEIARALAGEARILIMDEPTSSLTALDTRNLFKAIRDLKEQGVSILYVSHFLEEVMEIGDRAVILRDGRSVAEGNLNELTIPEIIHHMIGRDIDEFFPKVPHQPGETILRVENLEGLRLPRGVSLEVRRGEIIGIGGLVGAGRSEFLRTIFGLDPLKKGLVQVVKSKENLAHSSPLSALWVDGGEIRKRWQAGLGFVSEDRKNEGLATSLSIGENLSLTRLKPYTQRGIFLPWKRYQACSEWIRKLGIVCRSPDQPVRALSGGNQQKVAFGRLLHHDADLLLLDEPTRGIDVASKAHLYRLIGEAAAQGKAVVMVSSYLPELFGVCDRLAVMRKGILSELRPVPEWTEEQVMRFAVADNSTEIRISGGALG
ncbi:MAG: Ribose import ATP-binding protein RbsA [Candidatus Hinthialibacteria bacterium OLB16]|nr:MAG: Ribose import ATP-binding protein RbsA [Candidatus Hinthialibacteria bacterium OLB16]